MRLVRVRAGARARARVRVGVGVGVRVSSPEHRVQEAHEWCELPHLVSVRVWGEG